MQPIQPAKVQETLAQFVGKTVYLHVETTNGAYTEGTFGAFIRNAAVTLSTADIKGSGPYRAGLRISSGGFIYAEGLTDWELDAAGRLLLAGHDKQGRLTVALELSTSPFPF